jgi:cellulose synthase/poly-beta-1,6-N-acetylglucosamine synthase-like glycosyltransferase
MSALAQHRARAEALGLAFISPEHTPPDAALLKRADITDYLQQRFVPYGIAGDTLTVACSAPSDELRASLAKRYGPTITLAIITPRDIRSLLEQQFGKAILKQCQTQIAREMPDYSASYTFTADQSIALMLLLLALCAAFMLAPESTLLSALLIMNITYAITLAFKLLLLFKSPAPKQNRYQHKRLPSGDDLPTYSILVPMYREAKGIPRLLAAMRALDYPTDKLDIKLIIEADDTETWRAIQKAQPEPYFDVIRVPKSTPRTKPKACSYALHFVRGDYVTIFDAEDQPEPLQLRKAVAAFCAAPADTICLQARLNYYNWRENLLTRCFAIEYASLFDIALPAMQRLGLPIPLGGTSNHIDLAKLRELRDWDPYNVTEDADLGIRLAMRGYRTQMLDSVTLEEAPVRFIPWLKQRSRWIKGYLQTWLVYMRKPRETYKRLGARAFWGFQLTIGGPCLVFLLAPFLWAFSALWLLGAISSPISNSLMALCVGVFAIGYLSHFTYAYVTIQRWRWGKMEVTALLFPFYWFCHSLAALKAFWQLLWRPHYWEKTQHSVSQYQSREIAQATHRLRASGINA